MARNVKKGDMVEVIAGEAKGTVAKVMRIIT
jgi:ribosomal protein L24